MQCDGDQCTLVPITAIQPAAQVEEPPVPTGFQCDGDQCIWIGEVPADAPDASGLTPSPVDDFLEAGRLAGYRNPEDFLAWLQGALAGKGAPDCNPLEDFLQQHSLWLLLLLLIPLGMSLNLSPCTLPMIPITLAILQKSTKAATLRNLLFYAGGMALAYGALGGFVALSGTMIGAVNHTAWFQFLCAGLFLLLAIATTDLIQIDFSRFRKTFSPKNGFTVFCMGGMSALLASSCIAPVLLWVIGLSAKLYGEGNSLLPLVMPLFLGIGFALPWPMLGLAGQRILPKTGPWMLKIRRVLGGIIALAALYYLILGCRLLAAPSSAPNSKLWAKPPAEAFQEAKASGKPVLLLFTGESCPACVLLKTRTLSAPQVQEELTKCVCLQIGVDSHLNDAERELVQKYRVRGIPTCLLLQPTLQDKQDS